jgi:hypothetical protein
MLGFSFIERTSLRKHRATALSVLVHIYISRSVGLGVPCWMEMGFGRATWNDWILGRCALG